MSSDVSGNALIRFATDRPKTLTALMLAATAVIAMLAILPSLWPQHFAALNPVAVDTDPENMLSHDEPVRVFHDQMKKTLKLNDMVVLGVVNETHPDGVFNPESLARLHELTEFAKTLQWPARDGSGATEGVVVVDIIAPSTVDNIEQGGPGEVKFEWLMRTPPTTREEALAIRDKALRLPFLEDTMVSKDGKAVAVYLPLTSKDLSYRVYAALREEIAKLDSDDQYFITGLPVAEDTFGVEMFKQMAISAPAAMLVIFLLMLYFFRKLVLIVSPLIIAMVSVICTMGLLVITGNTIHIMSSMIPIFIMPIAVLDSIHILSQFFDRFQETRDRRKTIESVMRTLYKPMLYTSLTSTAGFASLALTPIPPVQVFGLFVAVGIMFAWFLTITFIPAYIMMLPERKLANFGAVHSSSGDGEAAHATSIGRFLASLGKFTYRRAKLIVAGAGVLLVIAGYGISLININDNPTRWFKPSHPIRVADRVLNEHFGGTYMAYLALKPVGEEVQSAEPKTAGEHAPQGEPSLPAGLDASGDAPALPAGLGEEPGLPAGLGGIEEPEPAPAEAMASAPGLEIFKQPEVLEYIAGFQAYLQQLEMVGKSNSLSQIVKTVHRELLDGTDEQYRIPETSRGVAETLIQYESSHRPGDLWHFVTPDFRTTSMWIQLKSGDNRDMSRVVAAADEYFATHPLEFTIDGEVITLEPKWFGLTYINIVWQEKMVSGMMQAFLGSFLVVLLLMILLFRSGLWGFLCMVPLTITIALIYGLIGLVGKDYDMPVAVLSSLTLGLAVDFAIHFLSRVRDLHDEYGSWAAAYEHVFGEPARAILRNIIVIAVGFLPLLLAPLRPYNTVGVLLALILFLSGFGALLLLPAMVKKLEKLLFPKTRALSVTCNCGTCFVASVAAVALVAVNIHQFMHIGYTHMTWLTIVSVLALMGLCYFASRRAACRTANASQPAKNTLDT